jgi:two-component system, LytTR family, sensor kinase
MRDNELRTLRAQLNPHFLFTSLNSLRGLIPESEERAQEAVTAQASVLRHTRRLSTSPLVSLGRAVEAAQNYLALETIDDDAPEGGAHPGGVSWPECKEVTR